MRVRVLINAGAGSVGDEQKRETEIEAVFAAAGADATAECIDPDDIDDTIRRWWNEDPRPDVIAIAGGDGTVSGAAAVAVDTDIVLTVLPLGTFNHFAKDLGIPVDLADAARAIVDGSVRCIDVGEVNGEVFVNNSSLGVYPTMVSIRDEIRDARGWGKIRAVPVAVFRVLRDPPIHRLDLEADGFRHRRQRTPFLFVGNGRFENEGGGLIEREDLDDGTLSVTLAQTSSRLRLIRAAVRAVVTGTRKVDDLVHAEVTDLVIRGRTRQLLVARDGEIRRLLLPLHYRCRPGALRVLAPTAPPPSDTDG